MKKAFKSPPKKGAFGSSAKSPFGSDTANVVQRDMWANMEPVEMDEAPWWTQISFGQVVSWGCIQTHEDHSAFTCQEIRLGSREHLFVFPKEALSLSNRICRLDCGTSLVFQGDHPDSECAQLRCSLLSKRMQWRARLNAEQLYG